MKKTNFLIIRNKQLGEIKDVVDFFISIANINFMDLDDKDLVAFNGEYFDFTLKFSATYPMLNSVPKLQRFELGASGRSPFDEIAEAKEFFSKIQSYLAGVFESLITLAKGADKVGIDEILSVSGEQKVLFDNSGGEFVVHFVPKDFMTVEKFNLQQEKTFLNLVFKDLIVEAGLRADRFRRCGKCPNYFYQYTGVERKYCSPRCSNAASQAKHYQRVKSSDVSSVKGALKGPKT